jgi:signal transduction histidine kinase
MFKTNNLILITTLIIFITMSSSFAKKIIQVNSSFSYLDLGNKLTYFEDKNSNLIINDISDNKNIRWKQSNKRVPAFGFSQSTYWLKIELDYNQIRDNDWIFEISYPALDYISFYQYTNKLITSYNTGDKFSFKKRPILHRNFLFPVKLIKNSNNIIYIKIKTSGSFQVPITMWKAKEFHDSEKNKLVLQGIFYGVMIVMIIYNLFIYFSIREINYFWYVLFVTFSTLAHAQLQGVAFQYLWPESIFIQETSINLLIGLSIISAAQFTGNFLNLRYFNKNYYNLINVITVLAVIISILSFILPYNISLQLIIILVVIGATSCIYLGFRTWYIGQKPAKYFTIGWLMFLVGALFISLNKIGLIERNFITENSIRIGSIMEVVLFSFALAYRIKLSNELKEKAEIETAKAIAKENMVQKLKETNKELVSTQSSLLKNSRLASIGSMASGIAHEINNPLTILRHNIGEIINILSSEKEENNKMKLSTHALKVDFNIERIAEIVDSLLEFSLEGEDKPFKEIDVDHLVENTINFCQQRFNQQKVELKLPESNDLSVIGNPQQIVQVIINLLINALEASKKNNKIPFPEVQLTIEENNDEVKFIVTDTGDGINSEIKNKIFDPFFTTKDIGKGPGLGLSISRGIILKHKGKLNFDEESSLTTFYFTLPKA